MKLAASITLLLSASFCFGQDEFSVRISIPQSSGIASASYEVFEVRGRKLYIIDEGYLWDTLSKDRVLKKYKISDSLLNELKKAIAETDSIGDHSGRCNFILGWPRFFISFNDNGRKKGGFIANVYRDHVYRIVDVFNKIYPKGDVIDYNKQELMKREKDCEREVFRD